MVVMHPNEVTRTIHVQNSARKSCISLLVRGPKLICREGRGKRVWGYVLPEQVVEQGPERYRKNDIMSGAHVDAAESHFLCSNRRSGHERPYRQVRAEHRLSWYHRPPM